ncbi:hypothetical protein [Mesoflavibacter sp. CH_XMU1404-2]|uniref:hypothetical protein n=1 Tax=Mesoflavibacter sp. CH_XMU1404-2 TaxID=3107766 RepID=UPI0030097FB2
MAGIENYLGEIVTGLVTSTAGLGAWLHERKQRKLQGQQTVVDLYQEVLTDLKNRYDEKFKDIESELESVKKNLDLWKGKYRSLKKEFEEYKEKHP